MRLFEEAAKALEHEGARTRALPRLDGGTVMWDDWTVKDVLAHVEAVDRGLLRALEGTVDVTGKPLAEVNEERRQERRDWTLEHTLAELEEARAAATARLRELDDADWERTTRTTTGRVWRLGEIAWLLSAHEREHREEIEAMLGRKEPGGRVASLNVSPGGVPKRPIFRARLGELGLEGDAHRNRMHGGPTAALCLFSLELIDRLRAEGHPIFPGAVGENVTVSGVDWVRVNPGDRFRIGPTLVEVTRYTTPCLNIRGAFVGEDFSRILATKHQGESRAYARVVEEGEITVGDPVVYQPA